MHRIRSRQSNGNGSSSSPRALRQHISLRRRPLSPEQFRKKLRESTESAVKESVRSRSVGLISGGQHLVGAKTEERREHEAEKKQAQRETLRNIQDAVMNRPLLMDQHGVDEQRTRPMSARPETSKAKANVEREAAASLASQQRGAEAFKRACLRLGQQPAMEVLADLRESGALVLDVQIFRDVEPVLVFLREAPAGIHQVVLYNGLLFFREDACYRVKLAAARRRMPSGVMKDQAQLRRLIVALTSFCATRGSGLAVLDLTGLPLGRCENLKLPASLAQCLTALPSLQQLHLSGCSLQDKGLVQLQPLLSGGGLPKLSHLSLARNNLHSLRILAQILQGRAEAQRKRKAVPLGLLDLSENPWLGAVPCATARPISPGRRPSEQRSEQFWRRRDHDPRYVSREGLLRMLVQALRAGLKLRTLRLQRMGLSSEDLRPLEQLLSREVAHLRAGMGRYFPLAEISLEGNLLDPTFEVSSAFSNMILQLSSTHSVRSRWANVAGRPGSGQHAKPHPPTWTVPPPRSETLRRSQSLPHGFEGLPDRFPLDLEVPERDALSEGDAEEIDSGQVQVDPQERARMRQQFIEELQVLSSRIESCGSTRSRPPRAPPTHTLTGPGSGRQQQSAPSSIAVDAIPDRGMEFGFGPPVLPGDPYSDASSSSSSDHARGNAWTLQLPDTELGRHLPPEQLHLLRAELQRHFFQGGGNLLQGFQDEGGNMPVDPMLRFALATDPTLAMQLISERVAAEDEDEDEDEEEEEDYEDYERGHSIAPRGANAGTGCGGGVEQARQRHITAHTSA